VHCTKQNHVSKPLHDHGRIIFGSITFGAAASRNVRKKLLSRKVDAKQASSKSQYFLLIDGSDVGATEEILDGGDKAWDNDPACCSGG
jgi:ADP-ribosylglycohydrolase